MKKIFSTIVIAIALMCAVSNSTYAQSHTRTGNTLTFAEEKKAGPTRKTTIDETDKKTGLSMEYNGKKYDIYLNKNNKAFILAEKKDGTGTYIKWLGAEKTAVVIAEMKK